MHEAAVDSTGRSATSIGVVRLLVAVMLTAFAVGCGDDFERAESADTASAQDIVTDATLDAVADASADTRADAGADTIQDAADTSDVALPVACTADSDCSGEAGGCQTAHCQEGLCWLKPAADGSACDDGQKCTTGETCSAGTCGGGKPDGTVAGCACTKAADCKDDGDACNGLPYCDPKDGVCKTNPATIVTCTPGSNACAPVACVTQGEGAQAKAACVAVPVADGTTCNDGDPCSEKDACKAGSCVGGKAICDCATNADCSAAEDGDACNGTLYCDTSSFPYKCRVNPATVPTIPADLEPSDCVTIACDAATGLPVQVTLADGTACDDGESCTKAESCLAGSCQGGTNQCPCKADADCVALDDGNPCNGVLKCVLGGSAPGCLTEPASVVQCADADLGPCLALACDPKDGTCKPSAANEGGPCSDDEVCTLGDTCKQGQCASGANGCACQQDSDCAPFDDDNLCNGTLFCDKSAAPFVCKTNPKTIVECPEAGGQCESNSCDPKTGSCTVVPLPDATTCDADGFACTQNDACKDGACMAGQNVCTCSNDEGCAPHEDGNLCNGTLFCNKSAVPFVCAVNPATVPSCQTAGDGTCEASTCVPSTGACATVSLPDGATCNADSDACTKGDACVSGTCIAGPQVCGCKSDADCKPFEDGDPCNGTLFCDNSGGTGQCKIASGSVVVCPSGKDQPCVKNLCTPSGGCAMQQLGASVDCDDGQLCTVGDHCEAGACKSGADLCGCKTDADCVPLDDGNLCNGVLFCAMAEGVGTCKPKPASEVVCSGKAKPCEALKCQPQTGLCLSVPVTETDTDDCDDGDVCTNGDACAGGVCLPGVPTPCDDDNVCTNDGCDPTKGCTSAPIKAQISCDDANPCTVQDACQAGTCVGKTKLCDDGNACTLDSCTKASGCVHVPAGGEASCDDGQKCTKDDICKGKSCVGTSICGDGEPCISVSCKESTGACSSVPLPDGVACGGANLCLPGVCSGSLGCVAKPGNEGKPCGSDGKTCSSGSCGACATGVESYGTFGALAGVVPHPDGGFFATGFTTKPIWLGAKADLQQVFQTTTNASKVAKFYGIPSGTMAHFGGFVHVGNYFANGDKSPAAYRIDKDGKELESREYDNFEVADVAPRNSSGAFLIGRHPSKSCPVVIRVGSDLKEDSRSVFEKTNLIVVNAGAAIDTNNVIAVGTSAAGMQNFWIAKLDTGGKNEAADWSVTAGNGGVANAVVANATTVYAAGWGYHNGSMIGAVVHAVKVSDGSKVWTTQEGLAGPGPATKWEAIALGADGLLLAGHSSGGKNGLHGRIARYGLDGSVVWAQNVSHGTSTAFYGVAWLPEGGGVAVGSSVQGSEGPFAARFAADGTIFCAP